MIVASFEALKSDSKVSLEPSFLQAEELHLPYPVSIADVLQPSEHLQSLLWSCSRGPQSWPQHCRWGHPSTVTSLSLLANLLVLTNSWLVHREKYIILYYSKHYRKNAIVQWAIFLPVLSHHSSWDWEAFAMLTAWLFLAIISYPLASLFFSARKLSRFPIR